MSAGKNPMKSRTYAPVRPPVTWFGGKAKLAARIVSAFPVHHTYVEPFGGSAAVLLAKAAAPVELYNDLDGALVNLFTVLRSEELSLKLHDRLVKTPYRRLEFELACTPCQSNLNATGVNLKGQFLTQDDQVEAYNPEM